MTSLFSAKRSVKPAAENVWPQSGGNRIGDRTGYILYTGIFLATSVISIYLVLHYWQEIAALKSYGYLGMFVIAFVSGSSIPTPVSYLLLTFTLGGIPGLHPALVGLAGGVGAGVGGTLVYLIGRGGRRFFPGLRHFSVDEAASNHLAAKFARWAHKRGSVVVFLMSAMLNPAFAPMAIAMGALRFRMVKFFIMCVLGNTLKAIIIAYIGYFGLGSLLRLLS